MWEVLYRPIRFDEPRSAIPPRDSHTEPRPEVQIPSPAQRFKSRAPPPSGSVISEIAGRQRQYGTRKRCVCAWEHRDTPFSSSVVYIGRVHVRDLSRHTRTRWNLTVSVMYIVDGYRIEWSRAEILSCCRWSHQRFDRWRRWPTAWAAGADADSARRTGAVGCEQQMQLHCPQ